MGLGDKLTKHGIQPKKTGISDSDKPLNVPEPETKQPATNNTSAAPVEPVAADGKLVFSPREGEGESRLQVILPESLFNAVEEYVADSKRAARINKKRATKNSIIGDILEKEMIAAGYYKANKS
jgi:hypothetical protein